jgi:hypothetical protein
MFFIGVSFCGFVWKVDYLWTYECNWAQTAFGIDEFKWLWQSISGRPKLALSF